MRYRWYHRPRQWINEVAWPRYSCLDCIGVGCGYECACYCAYYECPAPGEPCETWRHYLRQALIKLRIAYRWHRHVD